VLVDKLHNRWQGGSAPLRKSCPILIRLHRGLSMYGR
jgi:hypothetical protein